ncbi:permease prefix domain 1-containing protein [Halobacillus litoralis]|uniref:permease prefix domain 1-containing protein n=1 Tax=Halobacillus litoralis TaxID=45668 RepID=UPI001CD70194|nr:permease prefix domain 1-containing protein [Halobacillus litoralis]MCA0972182.1 permease prefix domain 1-containing protein [Halobacillus litoralis]
MDRLEKHVEHILNQTQSNQAEREEMKEDFLSHLYALKKKYEEEGFESEVAERKAIEDFGEADSVGNEMQETMYPYQRGLLYVIGLATIALGVFLHFALLNVFGEPSFGWLAIQLVVGTLVTLTAMNISLLGKYYWSVNVLVFLTAGWNGFNAFVVTQFPQVQMILFTIYIAVLIGLCLVFVIRNSYVYSLQESNDRSTRRLKKVSYIVNILAGALICGVALFFAYGFIVMVGINFFVLIPIGIFIGWLLFYKYLMELTSQKPVAAMVPGLIVIALITAFTVTPWVLQTRVHLFL